MSLNPFTLINQVIEEHGSAGIMGKHLAFLKEQLSVLKEESATAGLKTAMLESDNARLGAENKDLREQIQKLQPSAEWLDGDASKILKFYYEQTDAAAIGWVASELGMHPSEAEAHASDLSGMDFITFCGTNDSALYAIAPKGTKYVMKHLR